MTRQQDDGQLGWLKERKEGKDIRMDTPKYNSTCAIRSFRSFFPAHLATQARPQCGLFHALMFHRRGESAWVGACKSDER